MAILRWTEQGPFSELLRIHRDVDRLANLFLGEGTKPLAKNLPGVYPALNITADKDNIYVRAELPGIQINELEINATFDTLTINGQRRIEPGNEEISYHRRERKGGYFRRVINLPEEVNPEKAEAKYEQGVLKITIAKSEKAKPKQVAVKGI